MNENTVLTVVEDNPEDENYEILQTNLRELQEMKLLDGSPLNIIELPMPDPVIWEDQRLPASYANFTSRTSTLLYQLIDVIKTKKL